MQIRIDTYTGASTSRCLALVPRTWVLWSAIAPTSRSAAQRSHREMPNLGTGRLGGRASHVRSGESSSAGTTRRNDELPAMINALTGGGTIPTQASARGRRTSGTTMEPLPWLRMGPCTSSTAGRRLRSRDPASGVEQVAGNGRIQRRRRPSNSRNDQSVPGAHRLPAGCKGGFYSLIT